MTDHITTVIGDWEQPKVRLPGSGGANDLGAFCWRALYIMRNQSQRAFMEKLDFVTTPGWLGEREKAGLPAGCGPYRVITTPIKRFALISKYEYNIAPAWFNSKLFAENGFCCKELNHHAYCLSLKGRRVRQSVS